MKVFSVTTIIEFLLISSCVQAQNLRLTNGTLFAADDVTVKDIEEVVLPTETVETTQIVEVIPLNDDVTVKDIEEVVLPTETVETTQIVEVIPSNTSVYDLFSEVLPVPDSSEISEHTVINTTLSEPTTPVSDEVATTEPTTDDNMLFFNETATTTEETTPAASETDKSIPGANASTTQSSGGCGAGCIAAAVVCPIVGVFALVGIALFTRRRRRRRRNDTAEAFDPVF